MPDLTFEIDRTFAIDRPTMWSLWTESAHAAQWMRPSVTTYGETTATVDARPGGAYRFEMHHGDETYATSGTYVDVDPVDRLSFTWQWDGAPEETLVEVTFDEVADGTRVHVRHTRFDTEESARRHGEGWSGCLGSIGEIFEPAAFRPS